MRLSRYSSSKRGHASFSSRSTTSVAGIVAAGSSLSFSRGCGTAVTWIFSLCSRRLRARADMSWAVSCHKFSSKTWASARRRPPRPSEAKSLARDSTSARESCSWGTFCSASGRISAISQAVGLVSSWCTFLLGSLHLSLFALKTLQSGGINSGATRMLRLSSASSSFLLLSWMFLASTMHCLSRSENWCCFGFTFSARADTLSRLGTTSSARTRSACFTECWSKTSTWGSW
mmetsp:Transcript_69953/g.167046  ORF Transcript_69953/g.167046 Transcript_69953/m.167046 type:complete len:232 (-) Transcript_69953:430-1125(-)